MNTNLTTLKQFGSLLKIKGKYTPLSTPQSIEQVDAIWIIESKKKFLPYIFIETNQTKYLGIALARNSSDLLNAIAKKLILNQKAKTKLTESSFLIQYMFPNDFSSVKLFALTEWKDINQATFLFSWYEEIQTLFLQKISHLVSLIWSIDQEQTSNNANPNPNP
jgi:hypothetical protein